MIDWLLVARPNKYGHTADTAIVVEAIQEAGAKYECVRSRGRGFFDWLLRRRRARAAIHLERAFPRWFSAAGLHFLIPNQERFPRRHLRRLRRIDRVLAKTRHAEAIFASYGVATEWIGFTSPDRRDLSVAKDWGRFFHLAGGSTLKGTEDVLALWQQHPEWPELVLVQKGEHAPINPPANVTVLSGYMDDAALMRLQNECGVHLCPSRAEGWGHYIVEALSVGAVTIVTDAQPMNEIADADCAIMVKWSRSEPRHLGTCFFIDRPALEEAIAAVLAMPEAKRQTLGAAARARYEEIDAGFRERVAQLVARTRSGTKQ